MLSGNSAVLFPCALSLELASPLGPSRLLRVLCSAGLSGARSVHPGAAHRSPQRHSGQCALWFLRYARRLTAAVVFYTQHSSNVVHRGERVPHTHTPRACYNPPSAAATLFAPPHLRSTGQVVMGSVSAGSWFGKFVAADAVLVLAGGVLTAFVGVVGLVKRLALVRVVVVDVRTRVACVAVYDRDGGRWGREGGGGGSKRLAGKCRAQQIVVVAMAAHLAHLVLYGHTHPLPPLPTHPPPTLTPHTSMSVVTMCAAACPRTWWSPGSVHSASVSQAEPLPQDVHGHHSLLPGGQRVPGTHPEGQHPAAQRHLRAIVPVRAGPWEAVLCTRFWKSGVGRGRVGGLSVHPTHYSSCPWDLGSSTPRAKRHLFLCEWYFGTMWLVRDEVARCKRLACVGAAACGPVPRPHHHGQRSPACVDCS